MCGGTNTQRSALYPRVCGGTSCMKGSIPACAGEPSTDPRVCGGTSWIMTRSIPACAGEPCTIAGGWVRGVYPRVTSVQRSIPACAGEPSHSMGSRVYPRVPLGLLPVGVEHIESVYPRVCGGTGSAARSTQRGSIPACAGEPRSCCSIGSIPACAGEPPAIRVASRVYPRVCGGTGSAARWGMHNGLSPRVRGNPARWGRTQRTGMRWTLGHLEDRSIPACAGEPSSEVKAALSPRVRGNHFSSIASGRRLSAIPACAGERVYPRVCGGTQAIEAKDHRSIPAGGTASS